MEFIDKLDEEQKSNALMVARQAKAMGINPRLAVSLAYQESGLRMPERPGGAGEIGIMQVKPATGEMMGFSVEDLSQPETNIKAGLTYLKQGIQKFGDPVLAVAGYNAGHDHPYFTNPDRGLPESTKNYLKSIKGMGGFTEPESEDAAVEEAPAGGPGSVEVSEQDLAKQKARIMTDLIGAGTGAAAAKAIDVGHDVMEATRAMGENARAQAAAAKAGMPTAGAPGAPRPGGLPAPGGPIEGPPAGGRMTQNWVRAQDAGGAYEDVAQRARSMGEAHKMKEAAIQAENKIRQIAPEMRQVPERAGLFLPEQVGAGPRGARTAPIPPVPGPTPPGALQRAATAGKAGLGAMGRSPVLMGALGGLGAAEGGQEFYNRYKQGDIPGMILSGVGALGGLATAVPHPLVRGVGAAASGISPLTLYLLDKMRGKNAQPQELAPQQ